MQKGDGMVHTLREIASQPACWATARDLAAAAAGMAGLPLPGERVAVVGCGTSHNVAHAYAGLREAAGHGETDAWPASEFPADRRYDRVLAISRTGTTTELLDAVARVPVGVPTWAVTAVPDAPLVALSRHALVLDFADELSVVQTRFPTALLVLLRTQLGQDTAALPAAAAAALTAPLPERATGFRQYVFLGTGWASAIAAEAALKLRESAQAWAESYPAMEYRHGPMSVADDRSLVWFFGRVPSGLADEVRATGATVVTSAADPLVDLVRAQRLAVELAVDRGLDPDRPRGLARSVVLRS
jgi:fructoselysine-6-P-deglycase FrlB-like protein